MFAIEYNRGPVHIPAGALLTPRPSDLVPVILIGCCGLTYIDWISRRAEVSIYIGDKRFQQKGFGTTALDLLAGYAFRSCNLRKLTAEIYGSNLASIKLFQKAGYEREGILSGHVFKNGIYEDSHLYCLFLFDWKEVPKCAI
jgi:RimJ/RimL family protein N-acetyltransferase